MTVLESFQENFEIESSSYSFPFNIFFSQSKWYDNDTFQPRGLKCSNCFLYLYVTTIQYWFQNFLFGTYLANFESRINKLWPSIAHWAAWSICSDSYNNRCNVDAGYNILFQLFLFMTKVLCFEVDLFYSSYITNQTYQMRKTAFVISEVCYV